MTSEPVLGSLAYAWEIGRHGRSRYIWQACVNCGAARWVQYIRRGITVTTGSQCRKCFLTQVRRWKLDM